jgi:SWI/SNF-related matrix-associated actin-dependent regulator 1 of chromatin subfamily A
MKWSVTRREVGIATGQRWPATPVVVVNYDVLSKWPKRLREQPWDVVILDESAAIKNRQAARTKAVLGDKKAGLDPIPANYRVCLSGTPIENRPEELWTTLYFLDPARWGSFWSYAKRYCGMVNNGFGMDTSGATNLDELQRILRETVMIRRRKSDVLNELPPKTRIVVEMDGDGLEELVVAEERVMRKYNAELEVAQAAIELARASESDEEFKAAVKGLAAKTVAFDQMALVRHQTAVAKVPAMIEAILADLAEVGSCKALVFGHHHDVLEPLAAAFPGSVLITGQTPPEARQGICDRFQTEPGCGPFFGSIRACGEGLNLTAAKLVIFAEEDWVPGKVSQAEDRAHRIGQKDNVLVKHYVVPGTIDAKMIQTIVSKQEVIDRALDTDPGEWATEPVFVAEHKPLGKRKEIAEEALLITTEQNRSIHAALKRLAGVCDGAQKLDGAGFSAVDVAIGHALADLPVLSPRQAALGQRLCRKYHKQLGEKL